MTAFSLLVFISTALLLQLVAGLGIFVWRGATMKMKPRPSALFTCTAWTALHFLHSAPAST
jgi:hypothetical protein